MNEKGLIVLEQYELDVRSARRGRGSFLVDTDQGLKLLTEYAGTEGRLEFQDRVMKELREKGLERLDFPVRNKEGGFLVKDREETTYLLREWHEGRECDVRELSEVEEAVRALAFLHRNFRTAPEKETEKFREESLETELRRKNAELRRVRKFIRSRRRKTEFEQEFLNHFERFYEEAEKALEEAGSGKIRALFERSLTEGILCHGDYNQHHVLLSREGTALTDFGHCHFGVRTGDLARFFRKILEKQNWDKVYGNAMLREYSRVRPLSEEEREDFRVRLSYPEKFWKLADHYYGSRKSWIPEKNVEKLKSLIRQQDQRVSFLKILE
ncbi:MAG: CotS family spore coat protein [Lachnospiraceae bacterium]|nr:CotS family spore coat protein [Lachnospiraceae bacterium]